MMPWVWTPKSINRSEWAGFATDVFFILVGVFLAGAAAWSWSRGWYFITAFISVFAAIMLLIGSLMMLGTVNYIRREVLRRVTITDDGQVIIEMRSKEPMTYSLDEVQICANYTVDYWATPPTTFYNITLSYPGGSITIPRVKQVDFEKLVNQLGHGLPQCG